MRLLLDTHVWIWRMLEPERVSKIAQAAVSDPAAEIHLSPISVWETLLLARKGRIELRPAPVEWVLESLRRSAPQIAPLTVAIALGCERLDGFTSADPADRFIVASAREHGLTLVTADRAMLDYDGVETVW